jgi:hypothetical protein
MKKITLVVFAGLVFLWINPVFGQSDMTKINGDNMERRYFLQTIETGDLDWTSFIDAVINQKISFEEISPSAIANYLEGIANEGLMELIPSDYFYHEDLGVALAVVFENPSNICNNSSVYKEQLE